MSSLKEIDNCVVVPRGAAGPRPPIDCHRRPAREPSLGVKITRRLSRRLCAVKMCSCARSRLRLQDAAILDTATTDLCGQVIEVTVIDLSGTVLLSTLVRPTTAVRPAATSVHGVGDEDVLEAPTFSTIADQLLSATRRRQLLPYNALYDDHQVLTADLTAAGVNPAHLADRHNWVCLMRARALVEGRGWGAIGGPHHALGDCLASAKVFRGLTRRST